jgi:hypothetical protein
MSLDKIAQKNFCQNSIQIHQIHVKTASEKKTKFLFLLQFGPKAFLRRAAQPVSRGPAGGARPGGWRSAQRVVRGPSRPGQRGCRAQAATWAWAGNPAS